MSITATPPDTTVRTVDRPTTRSRRTDLSTLPAVLRSEWIKLTSIRSTKVILGLTTVIGVVACLAVARFVTDEVLTVAEVFVYSTFLTAVLASVAGILLFSSEVQHGTLAGSLTAQPARWVLVVAKTAVAAGVGLVLGAAGMVAGFVGSLLGGLDMGTTSDMVSTGFRALVFTTLSAVLGLGVGMVVRHSSGAISGLLVWWLVVENLLWLFLPEQIGRFLPYFAGGFLLGVEVDMATPETIAVALSPVQNALVFGGYAVAALLAGAVLLYRRDTD